MAKQGDRKEHTDRRMVQIKITDELQKRIRGTRFKRWWDLQTMPTLDWLQIEVTTIRLDGDCAFVHDCDNVDFQIQPFGDTMGRWPTWLACPPVFEKTVMINR